MTTHQYLFDEHVHSFYPTLAARIGLNEAIVLQQIHSWFGTYTKDPQTYRAKHYHDGAWWIWNSYPDWHEVLPYFSESTMARILKSLRKLGIVKVGNYNTLKIDRTYWYTIDYDAYDKLLQDQDTKIEAPSYQNDRMEATKLVGPLPSSSPAISASKEEPPLADFPPADESTDDAEETEAMFQAPPPAPKRRTTAEHKAAIGRAVESFETNGGRPGVADPTQDADPWADTVVREWCKIAKKDYGQMPIPARLKLAGIFRKVGAITDSDAVPIAEAIRRFPKEHEWWAEKVGFEWPTDSFCNKLGMMLVPDIQPEPPPKFTFVEPEWLGVVL